MKKRHFLKITAVLTAFFIASDPGCSYASAARVDSAASLNIPSDLGREEESFRGLSPKTILYIQDAHDSFEAQKNIASLVTHLTEKSGVKTVFEEGYEGPVPTDTFFGFIPDGETRLKVSAFLLDKLRIGGAEYAHINRKADFNLIGADHLEHYRQNIQAFRDAAEKNADIENDLTAILTEIESLVHQKFPKPLREWLDTRDRYEAGQLDLLAYAERGWKILESQPEGVASKKALPLISILLAARITPDETLAAKARAIEPQELFREITALDKAIAALFTREEKETLLLHYRSALHLLKRLNQIEVSPAEYAASKEILSGLNTRELADFIAQESRKSLVLSKAWEENIKTASRFYELAHQRDNAIEQTLRNYLSGTAENTAVLVYGGFHKAGILSILRKLGVSYRVITPNISGTDPVHENYYKKLMAEGVHDYEKSIFPSKGIASTATRPPSLFVETFGEASVQALYKAASQKPGTPMELLGQAVQESRSELRMVSSFDMELAFGELARTPDLSGGRNNDFLYEDGKKVAVILPWSKFIYRALDKDGREIPDRVYKITHYTAENEVLFEEAKKIFGLQTPGVSKLQRIGRLKDGGLWIELKGIPSARSLDREIFGRVERLFSTLIRAGELLEGIHERGVVHGDIKPGNLLINNDQELEWIDFGGNFTRGYAALNDEKQPLADSVSPDVDVYSFIMMMAHLLDHQIQSQPPAIAATLLRMRNEYLHLILKNWSFKNFEELLQVGVWTERLTPLPRKQRPQNMSAVIDKLKRDLSEIQTLLASEAGPEARSELRASSEGYNLIQHLFFEASITPETIAAAEALIPVPILDRLIREGYEFPEGFKTQAAPGAGRKLILDIQKGGGFLTVILKDALNPGHEFLKIPLSVEKKRLKLGFGHLNQFDEAKAAYPDYSDPVFAWWIARNLLPFARQSGFTILDLIQGPLSDADLKKSGFKRRNDGSGIPLWIYPLGQPLPNEVSRKQDLQKWVRQAPVLFSRPGVGSVIALPPENAAAFVPDAGQNWTMIQTFAEELAAVHRSAFRGNQPEENNPEQWVKHLTSPSMRILIQVNEEGTIEGYLLSEDWNSSPESVFLKSVAVIDEVQLQKKGGLLLDTFLMTVYNTSKSRKITWLSNFAVIALYKRYLERRNIPYEFDDWTKFTVPVSGLAAFSNALASGRSELRSVEEDAAEALGGSRRIILSAGEKILVSGFNPHKNTSALIEVRTVEKSPAREIGARVKSPRREAEIRVSAPADILILRDNEWLEFLEQHENPPADVNRLGQWNLLSLGSLRDSLLARSFGRRFMSWRAYLPAERKIHLFDLVTKARLEVEIIYADPLQNQAELSLRPAVTAAPDLFFSVQPISAVSQTQPQSTRSELRASYSEEPAASGLNLTGTLLLPDLFVASPAFTKLLTFKEFFFSTAPQGTRRGLIDDLINGRKAFSPRIQDHFRGPSPARRAFFIAGSPANPASEYSEYEIYKTLAGLLLNMLEEPEKQIFSDFYKQHFSSDRQFVKVIRGMGDFRGIVVSEGYLNSSSLPAIIRHEQFHMALDDFLKAASKTPALRKDFEDVRKLLPVFVSAGGLEILQASLGKLSAYSDPIEALKKGNFSFTEEFLAQTLYTAEAPAGLESAFATLKNTLARVEAENPDFQAGMRVLRRLQPSSDAKAAEKNALLNRYITQKQPEKQAAPAPEPPAEEGLASFSSESLRDLYVNAPQDFISNLTRLLQQHFTRAGMAGGALSVGNLIIIQVTEGASIRSASLDITGAVDFEQLSQKTQAFLTSRSELRTETPAQLLGFDRSTPLWDFLSAFGIDSSQAEVETLDGPWGRVPAAQHEAFGVEAGSDLREAVLESAYAVFDSRETRERLKEQSIPEDKAVDFLYLLTFGKIPVSLVWAIPGEPFQPLFYYPLAGPGLEPLWKGSSPEARTSISSPPLPQDLEFFIRAHHKKDFGKNPVLQGGLPLSMQRYGLPGGTLREFEEGLAFPTVFSLNHQTSKGLVETAGQLIAAGIFSIEGETVSEVGTGAGWIAAQMALRGAADVHAYDLNLMKAANAAQTARRHGVAGRFHAYRARSAKVLPSSRLYLWNIPDFADSASGVLDKKILDQSESIAVNNRIPVESVRQVFQDLSAKARADSLFLVRIHPWDEPAFFEMLKNSGWEMHPSSEKEIQNPGRGGSFFLLRPELEKEAAASRAGEDALRRDFRGTPETLEALRAVAKDLQPDQHGFPVLLIEGLPGSGKSSRAEDLKAVLKSQGRKAVVIHSELYLLQGRYNKPIRAFFGLLTRWIARQPNENLFDYAARAFVDTSRVERWIRDINALRAEGGLLTIDRDQKIQEKLTPDTVLIIEGTLSSHLFRKLSGAKRLFLDVPAKTIRHQFVKRTLFEAAGGVAYGSFKARLMAPGIAVGFFRRHAARFDFVLKTQASGAVSLIRPRMASASSLPAEASKDPSRSELRNTHPLDLTPEEKNLILESARSGFHRQGAVDETTPIWFFGEQEVVEPFIAPFFSQTSDKALPSEFFQDKKVLVMPGYGNLPFVLRAFGAREVVAADRDPVTIAWQKLKWKSGVENINNWLFVSENSRFLIQSAVRQEWLLSLNAPVDPSNTFDGMTFQTADILQPLPVTGEKYDLIVVPYLFGFAHGLVDESAWNKALANMDNALAPGGRIIMTPGDMDLSKLTDSREKDETREYFLWVKDLKKQGWEVSFSRRYPFINILGYEPVQASFAVLSRRSELRTESMEDEDPFARSEKEYEKLLLGLAALSSGTEPLFPALRFKQSLENEISSGPALREAVQIFAAASAEHNQGAYAQISPLELYLSDKRSWYDLFNNLLSPAVTSLYLLTQSSGTSAEETTRLRKTLEEYARRLIAMDILRKAGTDPANADFIRRAFEQIRGGKTPGGSFEETLNRFFEEIRQVFRRLPPDFKHEVSIAYTFKAPEEVAAHFGALEDTVTLAVLDLYRKRGFMMGEESTEPRPDAKPLYSRNLWIDPANPNFRFGALLELLKRGTEVTEGVYDQRDTEAAAALIQKTLTGKAAPESAPTLGLAGLSAWRDLLDKAITLDQRLSRRSELRSQDPRKAESGKVLPKAVDELKVMRASLRHYLRRQIEDRAIDPKKYEFVSDILPYRILAAKDARGKILGFAFGKKENRHMHAIVTEKDHEPDGFIYEKDDHGIRIITYVTEGDKNYKEDVFVLGRFGDVYRLKIEESGGHPSQQSIEYHNWMPSYMLTKAQEVEALSRVLGPQLYEGVQRFIPENARLVLAPGMEPEARMTYWPSVQGSVRSREEVFGGLDHEGFDVAHIRHPDSTQEQLAEGTAIRSLVNEPGRVQWTFEDNVQSTAIVLSGITLPVGSKRMYVPKNPDDMGRVTIGAGGAIQFPEGVEYDVIDTPGEKYRVAFVYTHLALADWVKPGAEIAAGDERTLGTIEKHRRYPYSPVVPHLHFAVMLFKESEIEKYPQLNYEILNRKLGPDQTVLYVNPLSLLDQEQRARLFVEGPEAASGFGSAAIQALNKDSLKSVRARVSHALLGIPVWTAAAPGELTESMLESDAVIRQTSAGWQVRLNSRLSADLPDDADKTLPDEDALIPHLKTLDLKLRQLRDAKSRSELRNFDAEDTLTDSVSEIGLSSVWKQAWTVFGKRAFSYENFKGKVSFLSKAVFQSRFQDLQKLGLASVDRKQNVSGRPLRVRLTNIHENGPQGTERQRQRELAFLIAQLSRPGDEEILRPQIQRVLSGESIFALPLETDSYEDQEIAMAGQGYDFPGLVIVFRTLKKLFGREYVKAVTLAEMLGKTSDRGRSIRALAEDLEALGIVETLRKGSTGSVWVRLSPKLDDSQLGKIEKALLEASRVKGDPSLSFKIRNILERKSAAADMNQSAVIKPSAKASGLFKLTLPAMVRAIEEEEIEQRRQGESEPSVRLNQIAARLGVSITSFHHSLLAEHADLRRLGIQGLTLGLPVDETKKPEPGKKKPLDGARARPAFETIIREAVSRLRGSDPDFAAIPIRTSVLARELGLSDTGLRDPLKELDLLPLLDELGVFSFKPASPALEEQAVKFLSSLGLEPSEPLAALVLGKSGAKRKVDALSPDVKRVQEILDRWQNDQELRRVQRRKDYVQSLQTKAAQHYEAAVSSQSGIEESKKVLQVIDPNHPEFSAAEPSIGKSGKRQTEYLVPDENRAAFETNFKIFQTAFLDELTNLKMRTQIDFKKLLAAATAADRNLAAEEMSFQRWTSFGSFSLEDIFRAGKKTSAFAAFWKAWDAAEGYPPLAEEMTKRLDVLRRFYQHRSELRITDEETLKKELRKNTSLLHWQLTLSSYLPEKGNDRIDITLQIARGIRVRLSAARSLFSDPGFEDAVHRYIAAWIYNLSIVYGTSFAAAGAEEDPSLVDPAKIETLLTKGDLSSIRESLSKGTENPLGIASYANAGRPVKIKRLTELTDEETEIQPVALQVKLQTQVPGTYLGIDIGGGSAKWAILRDGKLLDLPKELKSSTTLLTDSASNPVFESPEDYVARLTNRARDILDFLKKTYGIEKIDGVGIDIPGAADFNSNTMVTLGQIPVKKEWNQDQVTWTGREIPRRMAEALGLEPFRVKIRNDMDGVLPGVASVLPAAKKDFWERTGGHFGFDWMGTGHGNQYAVSGVPMNAPTESGHMTFEFGRPGQPLFDTEAYTSIPSMLIYARELVRTSGKGWPEISGDQLKPLADQAFYEGNDITQLERKAIALKVFERFAEKYAANLALRYVLANSSGFGNASEILLGGGIARGRTGALLRDLTLKQLRAYGLEQKIRITVIQDDDIRQAGLDPDDVGPAGSAYFIQSLLAPESHDGEEFEIDPGYLESPASASNDDTFQSLARRFEGRQLSWIDPAEKAPGARVRQADAAASFKKYVQWKTGAQAAPLLSDYHFTAGPSEEEIRAFPDLKKLVPNDPDLPGRRPLFGSVSGSFLTNEAGQRVFLVSIIQTGVNWKLLDRATKNRYDPIRGASLRPEGNLYSWYGSLIAAFEETLRAEGVHQIAVLSSEGIREIRTVSGVKIGDAIADKMYGKPGLGYETARVKLRDASGGEHELAVWKKELSKETSQRSELRESAGISNRGTLMISASSLSALTQKGKDELFSRMYLNRANLRLVIFRDGPALSGQALSALLKLPNVFVTAEKDYAAAARKQAIPGASVILLLGEEESLSSAEKRIKGVLLKNQAGEIEFARLLAFNGGSLPNVPEENGVFNPPADFLSDLNQRILSALVVAYSA